MEREQDLSIPGTIMRIEPGFVMGGTDESPVGIIETYNDEGEKDVGWYPLSDGRWSPGQEVVITRFLEVGEDDRPHTRYEVTPKVTPAE